MEELKGKRKGVISKNDTRPFHHFLRGAKVTVTLASWAWDPPYGALRTRDVRIT